MKCCEGEYFEFNFFEHSLAMSYSLLRRGLNFICCGCGYLACTGMGAFISDFVRNAD